MFQFSLADTLSTIAPYLSPVLVSPPIFSHIHDTARKLPAPLTDRIYLETRLQAGDPTVDLSFDTSATGYEILAGRNPCISFPVVRSANETWTHIRTLYRAFSDRSTLLGRQGTQILLEFDIEGHAPSIPSPGVFVGLKRTDGQESNAEDRRWRTEHYTRFACEVLAYMQAASLPRRVQEHLYLCCAALPPGAEVLYVGFMPARPCPSIRLCIARLPIALIFAYLEAIGWPGTAQQFVHLVSDLADPQAMPMLHVDVWDTVQPRIGMEFFCARKPQVTGHFAERNWLDQLVQMHLCTPEKRQALLAWPGSTAVQFSHAFWPTILQRRVNHVKLIWTPEAVAAKAYLFAMINARAR